VINEAIFVSFPVNDGKRNLMPYFGDKKYFMNRKLRTSRYTAGNQFADN
jgi:hypothetical protein